MVTPVNDRDVMLQNAASRDVDPLAGRYIQLDLNATSFHVSSSNQGSPSAITITAIPVNIVGGTPVFTIDNGKLTGTGYTRSLAYSDVTANTVNIGVSITDNNGNTFTTTKVITKIFDGANGTGTPGAQYATAFLYQFSTVAPSKPSGTSTYNWTTGNNTVYTANDGWTVTVPANNGNPLASLYVVAVPVTAAGGATSSLVSYASAAVQAWSQNGAKGDTGSSGMQYATASIYQQNANTPTGPVGPATWNWATGTFDYVPSGWTLNPPATLPVGYTLWAARVSLVTSATATQTPFNWNAAAISAIGYAGTNGAGQTGPAGSSYVTAYCASTTATTNTTPATTVGINTVPAQNDGGITGTWSKTVPQLVSGQYLYVTDGIFDPSTGKVTWSIPYWSSFKVGSLSALSGVMGRLTISDVISDAGNNWTIDSTGKMTCKSWQLLDANGAVVLQAGSALNATYAAAGTLNSALTPSIAAAAATANWTGVSNRPLDTTNLVWKGMFEDVSLGNWSSGSSVQSIGGAPGGAAYGLRFTLRDTVENGNTFPVNPGETIYVEGWMYSAEANYDIRMGLQLLTASGSKNWQAGASLAKGNGWTFVRGSLVVPATYVSGQPWLQIANDNGGTPGNAYMVGIRISRYQSGATYGLVSAANILSGGTGIVAGNLTWDGGGNRIDGYGTVMNQKGFAAYNSGGSLTFMVEAATGLVTARAMNILGPGDQIVLSTGQTLGQQVAGSPNLVPRLSSWPNVYSAAVYSNTNGHPALNGELISISGANGGYMGVESAPIGIPPNAMYTVSFDAHCYNGTRDITVDLYGTNVDTVGIYKTLTSTPTRYSFTESMSAAEAPQARLRVFGSAGSGVAEIYNVKVEIGVKMTPWCDSVITRANATTFIQSAAIQSAMINDLRTANYAEDGNGNPTSGAKLSSTGTALKVANNSLQVGTQIFSDYWFRLVQAIDGSIAAGRVIWRGNNDITTRGGAPNIDCLTMTPMSSQVLNSNFQQVTYGFTLTPSNYVSYTDNLDAMAQLHAQFFVPGSTNPFTEVYTACPSRTYDGSAGQVRGTVFHGWRFAGSGQTPGVGSQYETNGVYTGYLRVRLGNSYGWSATQDFGPASSVGTPLYRTTIGSGGSAGGGSGGGSGGGGGQCPAPWVKIRLVNGKEVPASQLHDGARVAAVNDSTMEPVVEGGVVRDVSVVWAQRFQLKLTNGEVTEWSENHRFYLVGRGWVEVQKLLPGDHIMGLNECIVDSVIATGEGQVVAYRVEGAGTYFGGGMLSHNIKMYQ